MLISLIAVMFLVWFIEYLVLTRSLPAVWIRILGEHVTRQIFRIFAAGVLIAFGSSLGWIQLDFLDAGDLSAVAQQMSWLGFEPHTPWNAVAAQFIFMVTLITTLAIALPLRKTLDPMRWRLARLPVILILAAANAAIEESLYRVIPMGWSGVPTDTKIWISVLAFGIPHYFGFPSRLPGVLLASFLGWFLAQSVAQTHGIAVAFVFHWIQDIAIIGLLMHSKQRSPFLVQPGDHVQAVARAFALANALLVVFQIALIAGAPWGRLAWGGQDAVLPLPARLGSVVGITLYILSVLLILDRTGLIRSRIKRPTIAKITWGWMAFSGLGVLLNLATPSHWERLVMGPLAILLAACVWTAARSKAR